MGGLIEIHSCRAKAQQLGPSRGNVKKEEAVFLHTRK